MSNITNYSFLFQSMFGGTKITWETGSTLPGVFQFSQLNSSAIQSQLKAAGIDTNSKQYKAVIQQVTTIKKLLIFPKAVKIKCLKL